MGLPQIEIEFRTKAVNAVERSKKGVVLLVIEQADGPEWCEYKSVADIKSEDKWDADNLGFIKRAFLGTPSKVIAVSVASKTELSAKLAWLKSVKFNYLATNAEEFTADIASWIKSCRENDKKTFKAVLANVSVADHEGIINFTTDEIQVSGDEIYGTVEYTSRIAGILAGLPFTRASTYYELQEVVEVKESEDPDKDVDDGKLILIDDGEKIKIGRGVNSLVSTTVEKGAEFQKIKIIDGMDQIREDISTVFADHYVGKVNNSYDNQVLFITSVNAYLKGIQGEILDPSYANRVEIDVEAQRLAWEGIGKDTESLSDDQIRQMSFRSSIFLAGQLKFLDSVEDLRFVVNL